MGSNPTSTAERRSDDELDQVLPAGDMSIFADLRLDEMELGAISADLDPTRRTR